MPQTKSRMMPKFVPAPDELVQQFESALNSIPEAEMRKMFGYPAAFVNGHMFAGIFGDQVMLRLSAEDRSLIEKKGAMPFEPIPGRVMKEYVVLPQSMLESPRQFKSWLGKALENARTLPPKPHKPRKAKAARS